jgi:hypothetical protein
MGRNTMSSREYIKYLENDILLMSGHMRREDIIVLKKILSFAEKHSNVIENRDQFFFSILIEIYKEAVENGDNSKRHWF